MTENNTPDTQTDSLSSEAFLEELLGIIPDEESPVGEERSGFTCLKVLPEDHSFPENSSSRRIDRFASVRRLESPVKLHTPRNFATLKARVLDACPHAPQAVEVLACSDEEWSEWGRLFPCVRCFWLGLRGVASPQWQSFTMKWLATLSKPSMFRA
ncbi:hypothetical protein MSKU15_2480 [Komagataeibacter diospyri]|uniref:hypothetical protein n=1 Tax=Komagataeibacter diospyri TaxID=1932662 RepID=UPI00113DD57D|nr:hypothetical protein [Komagataeibacter diospyri]GCE90879.1 hypothetical protein MSKU15_2480 [Komagataeibacter diospyri]